VQPAAPQNAAGAPPWETIASAADEGALALRGALRDVELAVCQVAEAGTQEQQAAAHGDPIPGLAELA
jgi:hypothetical protein